MHADDLTFDEAFATTIDGNPFSGVVYWLHPDGGVAREGRYRDGLPDGVQQSWFPTGRMACRWIALRGCGAKEMWSWHPNGRLCFYRRDVAQRPVELKAWDADGRALADVPACDAPLASLHALIGRERAAS